MAARYVQHPVEKQFAELEQQYKLDRLSGYWKAVLDARAERNARIELDPVAWRAAEMELRRAGNFDRAVCCQQMADELESAAGASPVQTDATGEAVE